VFGQNAPQHDLNQAEQLARGRHAHLADEGARESELGIARPRLRESMRLWLRRLTRRKPAEH